MQSKRPKAASVLLLPAVQASNTGRPDAPPAAAAPPGGPAGGDGVETEDKKDGPKSTTTQESGAEKSTGKSTVE